MLAFLWSIIRDTFEKLHCKPCKKFKTISAIKLLWHLKKEHNITPNKGDIKFLLRYNLVTRLLLSLVAIVLFIPLLVLKFVLIPLKYFYEIL